MPNVVLLKGNKVVAITYNVDADIALLSDEAKIDDLYDAAKGTFAPAPPPSVEEPFVGVTPPQIVNEHLMTEEQLAAAHKELADWEAAQSKK